jgi:ribose transport system permease protein
MSRQFQLQLSRGSGAPGSAGATVRILKAALDVPTVFWVGFLDGLLIIAFGLLSAGHVFWGIGNLQDMGVDAAEVVLLAMGEAFLLGAGEFDISLGANVVISSVLGGEVILHLAGTPTQILNNQYPHQGIALTLGVLTCLGTGTLMGAVNGLVVTVLRVNSLVATLATLGIATGTAYLITGGADLAELPTSLQTGFGIKSIVGIPLPAAAVAIVAVGLWLLLTKTRFGMRSLALGSSRVAARRAGIRVEPHLMLLFALVGLMAGMAGFIDLSRFATTNVSGHQTDALAAIAGAVIGGTSLFGGRVSIVGAIIGSFLAVILQVGLVIIGLQPFYQLIAVGVVLIIAVHIDQRRQARQDR